MLPVGNLSPRFPQLGSRDSSDAKGKLHIRFGHSLRFDRFSEIIVT
jgi:hypothetical protein